MNTSNRRSDSGLSLLEVIIASVILGVVLLATSAILFSTSTSSTRGQMNTNLGAQGKEFIELCKREFYDARFNDDGNSHRIGIHNKGTQVHFHVALGMDTDGSVSFGYVGNQHFTTGPTPTNVVDTGISITLKGQTRTVVRQNLTSWANYTCVIRFEPELVYYEGLTAPSVVYPPLTTPVPPGGDGDVSAPQTYKPNPYLSSVAPMNPGDPIPNWPLDPSKQPKLNMDINRDGDKNDVFVKGKIWMYVMDPYNAGLGLNQIVKHSQVLSDNVILAVAPDGTFRGDVDGIDSQPAAPAPLTGMRKDTLFRYLTQTPSLYGDTDLGTTTVYPGNTTAALGVTVWHGMLDDSGKLFHLRKTWERISFRLNRF